MQSCIDYAFFVRCSYSEQTKDLICRRNKRAARIIIGNLYFIDTRGADLLKDLEWQTLDIRRDLSILIYKCIKENAPVRPANELITSLPQTDMTAILELLLMGFYRFTSPPQNFLGARLDIKGLYHGIVYHSMEMF